MSADDYAHIQENLEAWRLRQIERTERASRRRRDLARELNGELTFWQLIKNAHAEAEQNTSHSVLQCEGECDEPAHTGDARTIAESTPAELARDARFYADPEATRTKHDRPAP